MKLMKKISAVLLSLCLLVPCFSMAVSAADGRISFTDPSTAVGEFFEVKCVLRSTSGDMGDVEVELSYDDEYLRFSEGDGIEAGDSGSLTCSGTANTAEVSFTAKFQALKEGSTKVEITGSTVSDVNGASLTLDHGSSVVTIAAGDPSLIEEAGDEPAAEASDLQVDVAGVTYTLTDDFADADIPAGYARTQRTLDGEERQMIENDNGSICLGYMKDAEGTGAFFLYDEETATFAPYAEISISDIASIIVLSDASEVSLPGRYQEAKLSLNEKEFPVWQDTESEGMYLLYAMNNNGEAGFYQYDSVEGTYQRFTPGETEVVEEETDASSILGKVMNFVKGHLSLVVLAVGIAAILGLLILIILAVKLHNRNAELDELYDEYGIDEEVEEVKPSKKEAKKEAKKESKKESKKARKAKVEEPVFEEEEFEEEDFEEEEFEEDFEEEEFEEDFEEEEFEEEEFEDYRETKAPEEALEEFTGFTERMDFTIDDLDELLEEKSDKRRGHFDEDDTFKIDFIDLD